MINTILTYYRYINIKGLTKLFNKNYSNFLCQNLDQRVLLNRELKMLECKNLEIILILMEHVYVLIVYVVNVNVK